MRADPLERKFARNAIVAVAADGTFTGHASLFGVRDLGGDVVERGAFAASLVRRGPSAVRMLYQHDPDRPIGRWLEICEDERGLFVRGRISVLTSLGREVLARMRSGALDGLSIGFRAVRAARDPRRHIRRILEVDLREISVVTFPMLPGARVHAVKAEWAAARQEPSLPELIRRVTSLINRGYRHDPCRTNRAGDQGRLRRAEGGLQRVPAVLRKFPRRQ